MERRRSLPFSINAIALLTAIVGTSGCNLQIRGGSARAAATPTATPGNSGPFAALNFYGSMPFSPQVTTSDSQRAINVTIPYPGRVYSFGLQEDGLDATSVTCPGLPAFARLNSNRLHFDLGTRATSGTQSILCSTTSGGSLTINLNYSASKIAAATGGFNEAPTSEFDVWDVSLSRNGRYVAMTLAQMSASGNIGTVYDRVTKNYRFATSNSAGIPDTSYTFNIRASDDGKYAVFVSSSTFLVSGASGQQIYRKNLVTGAVDLVSSVDGTAANRANASCNDPYISADGRYVFFETTASNIGTTGGNQQVFRKDMQTGVITLVSSPDGTTPANGNAYIADQSSDSRYLLLYTSATNLLSQATTGTQIFRVDLGSTRSVALVSSTDGTAANRGNGNSSDARMSSDARYVVFSSTATNLGFAITGTQAFRKDMQTGTIVLASSTDGTAANQATNGVSSFLGISDDGNQVLFRANNATGWFPGINRVEAFVRNISGNTIKLVSSTDGTTANRANSNVNYTNLSPDGKSAFYYTYAYNLTPNTSFSSGARVYEADTTSYAQTLLSHPVNGVAAQTDDSTWSPRISKDGTVATFDCYTANLFEGADGNTHICHKSFVTGEMKLIDSVDGTAATQADNGSDTSAVSADGRYVVFQSSATNLVAGTTMVHIYRKDVQTGALVLVSSTDGTAANRANASAVVPWISDDGRYVVFHSSATNLVAGTTGTQVFMKDMQTGTISLISSTDGTAANQANAAAQYAKISGDGTAVIFSSTATNLVAGTSNTQIFKKVIGGGITLVSSPDGTAANQASACDQYAYTRGVSTDGRYVAMTCSATTFVAGASGTQVYRKDTTLGTMVLVSSTDGTGANQANNPVYKPNLSPDGRYVVFSTSSSNLFAGTGGTGQVLWKDVQTGEIRLVSSQDGTAAKKAASQSDQAAVATGGRYVVFYSDAENLVPAVGAAQVFVRDMQ